MGLPAQERFTLQNVADLWGTSLHYVEEMVCTFKFNYIIVKGEVIGGEPLTRHIYFDRELWTQHYPEQPVILTEEQEKLLAAQRQSLNQKRRKEAQLTEDEERIVAKREKHIYQNIGPNEVANLWQSFPPSTRWERPNEVVVIYIPRVALEAFKKRYGPPEQADTKTAKKKDRSPAPDLSEIMPEKWYPTNQAARFLSMNQKYLQNHLIPYGKLKAEKRGRRYLVQGQEILNYTQKYLLKS